MIILHATEWNRIPVLHQSQKLTSGGLKITVKTGNYKILAENWEKNSLTRLGNDFFGYNNKSIGNKGKNKQVR